MMMAREISAMDFHEMRCSVRWKDAEIEQLDRALSASMAVVGIYERDELVAMGRLVGDHCFKALLTDIIVKPCYQRKGYGKIVVTQLLAIAIESMKKGDILCVEGTPTKGNLDFYIKCGFQYDPEVQGGIYLWLEK